MEQEILCNRRTNTSFCRGLDFATAEPRQSYRKFYRGCLTRCKLHQTFLGPAYHCQRRILIYLRRVLLRIYLPLPSVSPLLILGQNLTLLDERRRPDIGIRPGSDAAHWKKDKRSKCA